jgi:hypothetical protein
MKLGCAIKPVARKDEGHHGGGPRHAAASPLADSDSSAAWKFPHVLMCRLSSKAFKNGSPGQQEDREPHNSHCTTRYIAVWFAVVLWEATLPPYFHPSNFG